MTSKSKNDDIPDYMSDDLLKQIEVATSKEEEPSRYIVWQSKFKATDRRKKRKNAEETKPMKLKEKMSQKLEEGLTKSIPTNNIGHKLLTQMGYKEGMGLGKKGRR